MKWPPEAERRVREEARNTGEELPDALKNAPIMHLGMALYFNAFWELDMERDRSNFQPITRSSAFEYARDYDFAEEQTEDLWFIVARMDREAMKYWQSKVSKPGNKGEVKRG